MLNSSYATGGRPHKILHNKNAPIEFRYIYKVFDFLKERFKMTEANQKEEPHA